MFSGVKKIQIVVFIILEEAFYVHRVSCSFPMMQHGSVTWRVCHVSTVAQNGQSKHRF